MGLTEQDYAFLAIVATGEISSISQIRQRISVKFPELGGEGNRGDSRTGNLHAISQKLKALGLFTVKDRHWPETYVRRGIPHVPVARETAWRLTPRGLEVIGGLK
ncbi:MAG: hypothetical protein ACPGPS_04020 [Rubripirellula sp.]